MKRQNAVVIGILSLLLVLAARLPVNAIGFTWVAGDGDWHVPQFWAPYAPPVMGPPALGDVALITGDRDVTLSADALGIAGMVLQAQADVFTDGHQLTVVNLNGTAQTTVVGTSTSGNNTELFVEVVGGTTPGFIGDLVNLANGGELDLTGGAIAHVTNELDVDSLSIITGHGTIVFTDTHNVQGVRLNMRGTIRPDTNDTIRLVAESGTINLDGQGPAGPRLIDLKNSGSTLEVVGGLSDAFSGRIEMRPNTTLSISEPWSMGLEDADIPVLNFVGGTGQATITGAEVTIGSGTADINVVSGDLMIEANSRWQSAADIFVGANARLNIFGDNAIITGGSWTGTGTVNLNAQLTTIAADTDINMPGGTFDLDGNFTNETLAVNQTLRLFVAAVDDEGNFIHDRVQINGAAGQLEVHLTDPSATYGFAGDLELNGPGGGLTGVHLVGSGARLAGTTSVSGNSTVQAPLEFLSDVIFANGATLTLQGGSADDPNVVRSSATFAGSGELRVSSGAQLNVQDGVSTGLQVVNNGRFEPGLSLGIVNMRSFTQGSSGTLAMEIEGPPEVGQDRIVTTQSSHVDGDLEVTVSNGFIPNLANVYTLLSADSVTGTFDDLVLLSDSIFDYEATLTYPGTRVTLQFTDVSMQGDFSDDLALTCADVDALVAEIASGGADLSFDMTGDGLINAGDLDEWLDVAGTFNVGAPYLGGDANLDGVVDGADFLIWNANKFTNTPAWCQGDFTADGFIDGADFLIWNVNKFSESDLAATVPEPASQLLLLLCAALTARRSQRRA